MQLNKPIIYHIGNRLLFWTMLNFSLNLFGLWFSKIILKENFIFLESIRNEFIIPLLIQSLLFGLCFGTAYFFLKNKNISWLAFGAFQFLALHIAFLSGLKFVGGVHFETTISHLGLRYLGYHGQYLIDFIFTNKPLNGNFENGIFKPESTFLFYIMWVFSISLYFVGISWLSEKISDFFGFEKSKSENKNRIEDKIENSTINDN